MNFPPLLLDLWDHILVSLIPLFVAMDSPGTLPIYVGMTEGLKRQERKRVARQSIVTAFLVTLGFVLVGQAIFTALGILVEDFMIAGGIVLFIIAATEVVRAGERKMPLSPTFGVVPLGTPIIAGPAVLTTALVLAGSYGYLPVILSLIANLLFAWLVFSLADRIIHIVGINGARAFAKVASLILAAFAVMLIRTGLTKLLNG